MAANTIEIELIRLRFPAARPFADPSRLTRHGVFDWRKYTPIEVETDGNTYWLMNGVTRVENARRSGLTHLPAFVYEKEMTMDSYNDLYKQLLHTGMIVLRQAVDERDYDWIQAELELLHNIPSLIDENNEERHRYFWTQEIPHYLDWISSHGSAKAQSRMRTYYEPIWEQVLASQGNVSR